jgi:hypothetical protein
VTIMTMNCRASLIDYCGKLTRLLEEDLEKEQQDSQNGWRCQASWKTYSLLQKVVHR